MISREDLIAIVPIFNQTDDTDLPSDVQVGMIGCFWCGRAPPQGPFIVTAYDTETHMITAAQPFMRIVDGLLEFGHDTLVHEIHKPKQRGKCRRIENCDSLECNCGAYGREIKYMQTMDLSPNDYYTLETFMHYKYVGDWWTGHRYLRSDEPEWIF